MPTAAEYAKRPEVRLVLNFLREREAELLPGARVQEIDAMLCPGLRTGPQQAGSANAKAILWNCMDFGLVVRTGRCMDEGTFRLKSEIQN